MSFYFKHWDQVFDENLKTLAKNLHIFFDRLFWNPNQMIPFVLNLTEWQFAMLWMVQCVCDKFPVDGVYFCAFPAISYAAPIVLANAFVDQSNELFHLPWSPGCIGDNLFEQFRMLSSDVSRVVPGWCFARGFTTDFAIITPVFRLEIMPKLRLFTSGQLWGFFSIVFSFAGAPGIIDSALIYRI